METNRKHFTYNGSLSLLCNVQVPHGADSKILLKILYDKTKLTSVFLINAMVTLFERTVTEACC